MGFSGNYFEAAYNGNGHEIKGLTINGPSHGFIDYFNGPGSITDLHLMDINYNCTYSNSGGIVGIMGHYLPVVQLYQNVLFRV